MQQSGFVFPKKDRLCSHIDIEELFTSGKSFVNYPFRIIYIEKKLEEGQDAQVLFSVSKKKFKRAVHRNLLKRRIREAYRLNRMAFRKFLAEQNKQIIFGMVYISAEQLPYSVIEKGMKKALVKLMADMQKVE